MTDAYHQSYLYTISVERFEYYKNAALTDKTLNLPTHYSQLHTYLAEHQKALEAEEDYYKDDPSSETRKIIDEARDKHTILTYMRTLLDGYRNSDGTDNIDFQEYFINQYARNAALHMYDRQVRSYYKGNEDALQRLPELRHDTNIRNISAQARDDVNRMLHTNALVNFVKTKGDVAIMSETPLLPHHFPIYDQQGLGTALDIFSAICMRDDFLKDRIDLKRASYLIPE